MASTSRSVLTRGCRNIRSMVSHPPHRFRCTSSALLIESRSFNTHLFRTNYRFQSAAAQPSASLAATVHEDPNVEPTADAPSIRNEPGRTGDERVAETTRRSFRSGRRQQNAAYGRNRKAASIPLDEIMQRIEHEYNTYHQMSVKSVQDLLASIDLIDPKDTQISFIMRLFGLPLCEHPFHERLNKLHMFWHALEKNGFIFNISHYNSLALVYTELDYDFVPTDFLAKLEAKGIQPDMITYRWLLLRCSKLGDMDMAGSLLNEMQKQDIPLTDVIFNSLLYGYARLDDQESIDKLISMMRQNDLQPDDESYGYMIDGYASKGNMSRIKEVVEKSKLEGVVIFPGTIVRAATLLLQSGNSDKIVEFLKLFSDRHIKGVRMSTIFANLVRQGLAVEALKLVEGLESLINSNFDWLYLRTVLQSNLPIQTLKDCIAPIYDKNVNYEFGRVKIPEYLVRYGSWRVEDGKEAYKYFLKKYLDFNQTANLMSYIPLMVAELRSDNLKGFGEVLADIHRHDMDLPPNFFQECVFPNTERTLSEITEVFPSTMALDNCWNGYVAHCLDNGLGAEATRILEKLSLSRINSAFLSTFMVSYTFVTLDFGPAEKFLIKPATEFHSKTFTNIDTRIYFLKRFLRLCRIFGDKTDELVRFYNENSIRISRQVVEETSEFFSSYLPDLAQKLEPLVYENYASSSSASNVSGVDNRDHGSTKTERIRLLHDYADKSDAERFESLLLEDPELLNNKENLMAKAVSLYCALGDLENALKYRNMLLKTNRGFLDYKIQFNLAALLSSKGQFEDALKLILEVPLGKRPPFQSTIDFLATISGQQNIGDTLRMVQALQDVGMFTFPPKNFLAAIVNNHPEGGSSRDYWERYRTVDTATGDTHIPAALVLTKLVNDEAVLAEAFKHIEGAKGTKLAHLELSIAQVIAGNLNAAVKALEPISSLLSVQDALGLSKFLIHNKLNDQVLVWLKVVGKYFSHQPMDNLLEALAEQYRITGDYENSLKLYDHIRQMDGVVPSKTLLRTIARTLIVGGKPVPFQDSEDGEDSKGALDESVHSLNTRHDITSALHDGDVVKAAELALGATFVLPLREYIPILKALAKSEDHVQLLGRIVEHMVHSSRSSEFPFPVIQEIIRAGNTKALEEVHHIVAIENYDRYMLEAAAYRSKEGLEFLLNSCATNKDHAHFVHAFVFGDVVRKSPRLLPLAHKIHDKAVGEWNIMSPVSLVLLSHYAAEGNIEIVEKLFKDLERVEKPLTVCTNVAIQARKLRKTPTLENFMKSSYVRDDPEKLAIFKSYYLLNIVDDRAKVQKFVEEAQKAEYAKHLIPKFLIVAKRVWPDIETRMLMHPRAAPSSEV